MEKDVHRLGNADTVDLLYKPKDDEGGTTTAVWEDNVSSLFGITDSSLLVYEIGHTSSM